MAQWLVRDSAEKAFRNRAVIKWAGRVSLIEVWRAHATQWAVRGQLKRVWGSGRDAVVFEGQLAVGFEMRVAQWCKSPLTDFGEPM